MNTDPNFQKLRQGISELKKSLEGKRRFYLRLLIAAVCLCVFGGFAVSMVFSGEKTSALSLQAILPVSLIPAFIFYFILGRQYEKRGLELTDSALEKAGFSSKPEGKISWKDLKKHKVVSPSKENADSDTSLGGVYQGIGFIMTLFTETAHGEKIVTRLKTLRPFAGHTVILPRKLAAAVSELQTVEVSHKGLDAAYAVLASDPVEAKMIVNGALAQFLLDSGTASISLMNNEIVCLRNRTTTLLRCPPLWQPVTERYLNKTVDDLESFFSFIPVLKNNKQIAL